MYLSFAPTFLNTTHLRIFWAVLYQTGEPLYIFKYSAPYFFVPAITHDKNIIIVMSCEWGGRLGEISRVTGNPIYSIPLKYPGRRDITEMKALPGKSDLLVLFDREKATLINFSRKEHIRSMYCWNTGECSRDGNWGVFAPSDGRLEVFDLSSSSENRVSSSFENRVRALLPRSAGVPSSAELVTRFLLDDQLLLFYRKLELTVKIFRVSNARLVADFSVPSDVTAIGSQGDRLVLGFVDGQVAVLLLTDPADPAASARAISRLPGRGRSVLPVSALFASKAAAKFKLLPARSAPNGQSGHNWNSKTPLIHISKIWKLYLTINYFP